MSESVDTSEEYDVNRSQQFIMGMALFNPQQRAYFKKKRPQSVKSGRAKFDAIVSKQHMEQLRRQNNRTATSQPPGARNAFKSQATKNLRRPRQIDYEKSGSEGPETDTEAASFKAGQKVERLVKARSGNKTTKHRKQKHDGSSFANAAAAAKKQGRDTASLHDSYSVSEATDRQLLSNRSRSNKKHPPTGPLSRRSTDSNFSKLPENVQQRFGQLAERRLTALEKKISQKSGEPVGESATPTKGNYVMGREGMRQSMI